MYERFLLLCAELNLPPCAGGCHQEFFVELQARMERKAARLQALLPGLSWASSLDAISRASVMLSWARTLDTFRRTDTQAELEESAWELTDLLPACFEPGKAEMPLSVVPRVCVRTFAERLQEALRLDAPHAFHVAAELFGARDWVSLAGRKPFLPIAEPLYTYRTVSAENLPELSAHLAARLPLQSPAQRPYAALEPCNAARQADAEFEALTLFRQPVFALDYAQSESVDHPSLLCAASVAATLRVENGEFEVAEWKARMALEALDLEYPADCQLPLAPGEKAHLYYVRLRAARYAALLHSGNTAEAIVEWSILMSRGREYQQEIFRILREVAPHGARPQHRSALRLVS
ncbi:hypothetical protein CR51_35980 [Caballeronia megalochromosomata]|nr:hypothetical protein CR51_35980 [Caballeronia megalochromosomata]